MKPIFKRLPLDGNPPITGRFGDVYGTYQHRGVDFGVPEGTPVRAPAGGRGVIHRPGDGWGDGSFGICIVIDHDPEQSGKGPFSLYGHLSSTAILNGQRVNVGDVIAWTGNTGKSTGPHLHWQACLDPWFGVDIKRSLDPLKLLISEEDDMSADDKALLDALLKGIFGSRERLQSYLEADLAERARTLQNRIDYLETTSLNGAYAYVDAHNANPDAHPALKDRDQ